MRACVKRTARTVLNILPIRCAKFMHGRIGDEAVCMADTLSPTQRSERMGRVHGKDTKPELAVRRLVHKLGYRFRLHRKDLPGTPDLVFPRLKSVIFVHGCFGIVIPTRNARWHDYQSRVLDFGSLNSAPIGSVICIIRHCFPRQGGGFWLSGSASCAIKNN